MPFGFGLPSATPPDNKNQSALSLAWLDEGGAVVSVRFDVVSSETHEALMQVTDHAVEVGANVVDNAREMPDTISIQGFVSNKPLPGNPGMAQILTKQSVPIKLTEKKGGPFPISPGGLTSLATGALDTLLNGGPPDHLSVFTPQGDFPDRVRAMFETLSAAKSARALIRVVTALRDIDSMLIARLGVPRSITDGTGATFHVELRKIRLVSSETVDAPEPAEARGMITAATGSKSTKEASDAAAAKGKSVAAAGYDAIGRVFTGH